MADQLLQEHRAVVVVARVDLEQAQDLAYKPEPTTPSRWALAALREPQLRQLAKELTGQTRYLAASPLPVVVVVVVVIQGFSQAKTAVQVAAVLVLVD